MHRRPRARAASFVLAAALWVAGGLCAAAGAVAAAGPLHVTVSFDRHASLGSSTALDVVLRLDAQRLTSAQPTEVRFAYPRSVGLVSSGLGLATCTRPAADFAAVLISAPGLGGCPPNAVMGKGTALALVRLVDGQVIPEYAGVTLLSGPIEHGRLGLVVYIDGRHPFGGKLAFEGTVSDAAPPYGGALTVRLPTVPGIREVATISLVELHLTIGSHAIRYYEHRHGQLVAYRPDGIQLPTGCPRHGFRFAAQVRFSDGSRRAASSTTPCPRAVAPPASGR